MASWEDKKENDRRGRALPLAQRDSPNKSRDKARMKSLVFMTKQSKPAGGRESIESESAMWRVVAKMVLLSTDQDTV